MLLNFQYWTLAITHLRKKPASIQPRPQIPGRDEHVTKRLDQQARLPTRPAIREQSEQIRGQPHQYAQMTPIPETEDIEIEIKWPKRQKPSTNKPKKPAGHRRLTTYYQRPNCNAKHQMHRLKNSQSKWYPPIIVCSERKTLSDSIQTRPQLPKKDMST